MNKLSEKNSRLFFALWPDTALQQHCYSVAHALHAQCGGNLVPPHNIHLTLVFIGNVEKARIPLLIDAVKGVRSEIFSLQLNQVGAFRESKVAWLAPAQAPPELALLVNNLRSALTHAGFSFDNKPYVPHLTLLRKTGGVDVAVLDRTIEWRVNGFALMQSHSEADGVRYEVLKEFTD